MKPISELTCDQIKTIKLISFDSDGVLVKKVAVLMAPEKKRMRGRQVGWRSGFKKAVVTLKEGQSIEIQ